MADRIYSAPCSLMAHDDTAHGLGVTQQALYDGRAVTSVRPGAEPYILFYHRSQRVVPSRTVCPSPCSSGPLECELQHA